MVVLPSDPAWQERDWVNGYFPTGVPFRFRLLTCEANGCGKLAVACALEDDDGDWPFLFSLESDFLGDLRHDRFFCEEHLPDDV